MAPLLANSWLFVKQQDRNSDKNQRDLLLLTAEKAASSTSLAR
jgi:hypothetical protein